MPRPTPAQVAYGCLTVVLSTFAVLMLSDVRSGPGVVAVAAAGLVLGLIVAAVLRPQGRTSAAPAAPADPALSPAVPRARVRGGMEPRVSEGSLRR